MIKLLPCPFCGGEATVTHKNYRGIEVNELPSIEQSKKLKPKVERRDKKTIERDKLLGVSANYLSYRY